MALELWVFESCGVSSKGIKPWTIYYIEKNALLKEFWSKEIQVWEIMQKINDDVSRLTLINNSWISLFVTRNKELLDTILLLVEERSSDKSLH